MNRRVYCLAGVGACVLVASLGAVATASEAARGSIWQHFAVRQASHQIADPFEEEPGAPMKRSLADQPAEAMPPDPAYQIPVAPPRVQPPATPRVQPPAPLIPPEADVPPVPQPPAMPPAPVPSHTLSPVQDDMWASSCVSGACCADAYAGCCEVQTCSPFRSFFCDALRRARYADCDPCEMDGLRNGGLPLGIRWEGWLAQGATLNTRSPGNRSNFPVTFNDRSNDYQFNQLYLAAERAVRDDSWSVGGRMDLLYGTDHRFAVSRGLEVRGDGSPKWNSGDYGLAMPQLYMEAFAPIGSGVNVKMGHFYTILGYETVPAPDNFFYSHAYTMQYGEPFTHTGCLASTNVGPLQLQGGFTRGWDNWENTNDEYGFLGGVSWTSHDERTSLAFALHTGREEGALSPATNTRTTYSSVFSHDFYGPWSCVFQHDLGIDRGVRQDGSDATWYGMNMYLFREITERWKFGYRFEWFRDNNGTRVVEGLAADYYQMSWGLNYTPSDRLRIRPSLRWDWTGSRDARPYINGTSNEQLLLDCDVLIQF